MKKFFQWYLNAPLIWLNIGAFVFGCAAGLIIWKIGNSGYAGLASQITTVLAPFGNVLISMLKMIVIPIIFGSLVCGAASLPFRQFGKMGAAVVIWYLATSLYAALFGTFTALVCNPTLKNSDVLAGSMLEQAQAMHAKEEARQGGEQQNCIEQPAVPYFPAQPWDQRHDQRAQQPAAEHVRGEMCADKYPGKANKQRQQDGQHP